MRSPPRRPFCNTPGSACQSGRHGTRTGAQAGGRHRGAVHVTAPMAAENPIAAGEAPLAALLPPPGETLAPDAVLDRFVSWVSGTGLSLYPHQEEAILQLL